MRLQAQFDDAARQPLSVPVGPNNAWALDSMYMLFSSRASHLLRQPTAQLPARIFTWLQAKTGQAGQPAGSTGQRAPLPSGSRLATTVCSIVSGRTFLLQDSLQMWPSDPVLTSDGNVLVAGEWADFTAYPYRSGGFCMKTDQDGHVIWARLYDSSAHQPGDFINYSKVLELRDHTIMLAGRTENRILGNNDLIVTRLDNAGNIIWSKTYRSRLWLPGNGSADAFTLHDLKEDPATGDFYVAGGHWDPGNSTIIKLDPANGTLLWSNAYDVRTNDQPFGLVVNADKLLLFHLSFDSYNFTAVDITAVNKVSGDTLFSRHFKNTGDIHEPAMYGTMEVTKLNNGHYMMASYLTGNNEYPIYTGTTDLYHAAVMEFDENLNFVRSYGFKNRQQSNVYNTRVSFFPDGTGIFTMLDIHSNYTMDSYISIFKERQMYHQRKRSHVNEGVPDEPYTLQTPAGSYLNIKIVGDSARDAQHARFDYYRMHPSDTSSACLGVKDSSASFRDFYFIPASRGYDSIRRNVFSETRLKTLRSHLFQAVPTPACQTVAHCDSLSMSLSATTVCQGTPVTVTLHKNRECGSLVPLSYDSLWVSQVTRLSDTVYRFNFKGNGKGYIKASIIGCTLKQDSVYVEVLPAKNAVTLGKDTAICPGNSLMLHAGDGFASYRWQNGSSDSTFLVTAPGKYAVEVVNGCGSVFRDTVEVMLRHPVSLNLGPDRTKCNSDTLHLSAPAGFLNYTWSNNYQLSSVNTQTVVANPAVDTAYYLAAEKTPGCFAYDTVRVRVYHSPAIDLGQDKSFCMSDSAVFDAGAGFQTYRWSNGQSGQQVTVRSAGTYTVTGITAHGCRSYDTAQVFRVFALPVILLDKGNALCSGDSKLLTAGKFQAYLWNTGATTQSIRVNSMGQYAVTVIDSNGCRNSDTTSINIMYPLPAAFLPADTVVCSYGTVELKTAVSFSRYQWSTGGSTSSVIVSKPGMYWVKVKDEHGCNGADTTRVSQKQCMTGFYIPTAFSPNNDGKNDIFRPLLFGNVQKYRFTVYDRWGAIVFQTSDLQKGWDGKRQNFYLQSGVFVWTCLYQFAGEPEKLEKGTVIVIR